MSQELTTIPKDQEVLSPSKPDQPVSAQHAPAIVRDAGPRAEFAWSEFFQGEIANAYTRKNYIHAVTKFLAWWQQKQLPLDRVSRGHVCEYLQQLDLAVPTKKLHLAALRRFFDRLVKRHVVFINPAATVRAEKYSADEGKTPEIKPRQVEALLRSITTTFSAKAVDPVTGRLTTEDVQDAVGLRDRAILSVLVFTAARVGAVSKLTTKSVRHDGTQYTLRFAEKGGKAREIPVRHDLERILLEYLQATGITQ
jgi:integrase/recombinase XerD